MGRCRDKTVRYPCPGIDTNMSLYSKVQLIAFLALMHL